MLCTPHYAAKTAHHDPHHHWHWPVHPAIRPQAAWHLLKVVLHEQDRAEHLLGGQKMVDICACGPDRLACIESRCVASWGPSLGRHGRLVTHKAVSQEGHKRRPFPLLTHHRHAALGNSNACASKSLWAGTWVWYCTEQQSSC
jgi:hypothetical protein